MAIVKFSDVAKRVNIHVNQKTTTLEYYVGGEHIDSSELMVRKKAPIKGSTIGYQFQFGFKSGHILFMTKNPHLRKASMVDFDGLCSIASFVIESLNPNILLQEYLLLEMQSDRFWNYCEENKSGSVNYFINWSTLADYEFELPPIERQRELADLLWAANDLKEAYKKLIDASDEMLKAKFREMFKNVKCCPLSEIAEEWFKGQPFKKDKIIENGIHLCIHYGELITKYGPVITDIFSKTNEKKLRCSSYGDIVFPATAETPEGLCRWAHLSYSPVIYLYSLYCVAI